MANVRDPAFWRRFSMAVHLDEEQNTTPDTKSASSNGSRPSIKHTYVLQNLPMMRISLTHILPANRGLIGTARNSDGQNALAGSSFSLPSLSLLPSF
jgi:hypothetical protein